MSSPITGICIVSDPCKCPPKHELLFKSYDRKDDCDLWKDGGMFRSKSTRYICISNAPEVSETGGIRHVVTDIMILNERDVPPYGYVLLEKTIDTGERATKKKQICVKYVPRNMADSGVNEVIVLSKTKHSPPGFILVGDINGLYLCIKMGVIPNEMPSSMTDLTNKQIAQSSPIHGYQQRSEHSSRSETPTLALSNGMLVMNCTADTISHLEENKYSSSLPISPLSDVPFQLHARLTKDNIMKTHRSSEHFKSISDIESEFSYTFTLENSVIRQIPSCSG